MPEVIAVTDLDSALQAISLITEDGEGSSLGNIHDSSGNKSHFFTFLEMYYGKKLKYMEE